MQPPKEVTHFLQLLIIQLSKKPRIPTTTIPNITTQASLEEAMEKDPGKDPSKAHPYTIYPSRTSSCSRTNPKASFDFKSLLTISNCLPYPHSMPLSQSFCAPTPIFLPILANDYLF